MGSNLERSKLGSAVHDPKKVTPVELVRVEEASRADPVLATILSGDLKYIGQEDLLLAGRKWRADKFELKVPLNAPFVIWTSPEGLLLGFAPENNNKRLSQAGMQFGQLSAMAGVLKMANSTAVRKAENDMRVLMAIDPSSGSQQVVNEVTARPWPTGTAICVLSIVDMGRWEGLPALIEDAKRAARVLVETVVEKLDRPGLEVLWDIQLGYPKKAIPDFAREWKADLAMVGSRGLGAISRFFLGSVAHAVLRFVPCSVEIVRSASAGSPASSHAMKILLATDGSECSEIAIRSVANRPWPAGSEIRIVSVRELLTLENATSASSPCPIYPESLLNEILEDARKCADKAIAQARQALTSKGLKVCDGPGTPVGDARAILLDEARAWGVDLIILGSHGRHGFDRLVLGSVSESVALYANCSVEVIRG